MTSSGHSSEMPPSLAGAAWLARQETQTVFRVIAAAGFSVRVVGGAVRNALLGQPVRDIDFATSAPPEEVMALAKAAGLEVVPTGIAHGTVMVIVGHAAFEVTTLRQDVETFGRHARVAFTDDWVGDAQRRDFTINALYCDADGRVSDPLGGAADLAAGRVRFIGEAEARIREDYLRILRFFRFHAEYGRGDIDVAGLDACVRECDGLRHLSGERIRAELVKLLVAPGAAGSVAAMAEHGILPVVLGGTSDVATFKHMTEVDDASGYPAEPMLRLATLALPATDPAALKTRLRLSTHEAARLGRLVNGIAGLGRAMQEADAKAAIYRLGGSVLADAARLVWARTADPVDDPSWRALLALAAAWQPPVFPLRGADLLARGVAPGPRVGQVLSALEDWWISQGFPPEPARIEDRLAELLRQHGT